MTDIDMDGLQHQLQIRLNKTGQEAWEHHLRRVWLPQALDAATLETVQAMPLDYITGLYPEICVYGPRVGSARAISLNVERLLGKTKYVFDIAWELQQTYRDNYMTENQATWDKWDPFVAREHQQQIFSTARVYNPLLTRPYTLLNQLLDPSDKAAGIITGMFMTELLGPALGRQRFGGFMSLHKRHERFVNRWRLRD